MEQYTYVTSYKDNERLRAAFNKLTTDTFGFDFESWYQNGYWKEDAYMPHSLIDGERMVANVSANRMEFVIDGETKHYIQIGTVMTAKEYQGQGLGRYLMEKVIALYQEEGDGIYLFGNDSVLDFYPKFGFKTSKEYVYKKTLKAEESSSDKNNREFIEIKNPSNEERQRFFDYVQHAVSNDGMTMKNVGLMGFYVHDMEGVYYNKKLDTYIVAEIEDEILYLNAIIAKEKVELNEILDTFAGDVKTVVLGFVPSSKEGFDVEEFKEEDCTLFYLGEELKKEEQLHFPALSHA